MNNEEKEINQPAPRTTNVELTTPIIEERPQVIDERQQEELDRLEDDIIRNDTIPETSRDTPGSNGAFPVGAFDTSKD